jgi:hypothetical protein
MLSALAGLIDRRPGRLLFAVLAITAIGPRSVFMSAIT